MSLNRFTDKTVFISGGSKGIGLSCAHRFATEGADVFLASSNASLLAEARQKIEAATGRKVGFHAADLRSLEACEAAAASMLSEFGRCDILINCAGATRGGLFPEQPDDDMLDGFALKFHAAVRLSRCLWPSLVASSGSVVNVVGGFARTPAADYMVGGAVNAALANFSKALAAKGLQDDVNVNWIHPGLTVTERLETIFADRAVQQGKTAAQVQEAMVADEGIRRLGEPEDVAALVAFLCSAEARHIQGAGIPIDGGGSKGYV